MNDPKQAELVEGLFEVVGFMLVSARGLVDEPGAYGPARLIDAASRLISMLDKQGMSTRALDRIRDRIEEGKFACMGSPEEYRDFLESLVLLLVAQIGETSHPGVD